MAKKPPPPRLVRGSRSAAAVVVEQLSANRAHAMEAANRIGGKKLARLMARAKLVLDKRIATINPGATFTLAAQRQTLEQVRAIQRMLKVGIEQAVKEQGHTAAVAGAEATMRYLIDAERAYTGISTLGPRLQEAVQLDVAVAGADSTVLRRVATDPSHRGKQAQLGVMDRYGIAVVSKFEETMQTALLTNQPWAETRQALIGDSEWLQQAPLSWAERILRTECLLGDTLVSGAVVRAVHRRWYKGNVVWFTTDGGRKFTTTPNHPMLTRRGWVHAGELHEGDYLVCYRGKQDTGAPGDKHVEHPPTTIAEIYDAVQAIGISERRRTAQPDFHGDGMDGYVDVSCPGRQLRVGMFAALKKPLVEQILSPAGVSRSAFCSSCGRLLSIDEQPCECRGSDLAPNFGQPAGYELVANTKPSRDVLGALSSGVGGGYGNRVDGVVALWVLEHSVPILGSSRSWSHDARSLDHPLDPLFGEVEAYGGLLCAEPGEVEFDRVCSVGVRVFEGHVYNLTTPHGYFAVNGAYTGNTMSALNRSAHDTMQQAEEELGPMVRILCAIFDDRTSWDSYQVHGMVRRMDEPFEDGMGRLYMAPPNRPNDRECVVPHMLDWPLPPELTPRSDDEVQAAWVRQTRSKKYPGGRPGGPPPRPLMSTVPGFGGPEE